MRRVAAAAWALAWAAAANGAESESRGLQLGVSYTNNEGATQSAMVGAVEGCYKVGGATAKLTNVVCIDKATASALSTAKRTCVWGGRTAWEFTSRVSMTQFETIQSRHFGCLYAVHNAPFTALRAFPQ